MSMIAIPKNANFELNGLTGHVKFIDHSCALLDFDDRGVKMYEPHQLHDAYVEGEFKILEKKSIHALSDVTDPKKLHLYKYYKEVLSYMDNARFPQSTKVIEEALALADSKLGQLNGGPISQSKVKRLYVKWSNNGYSINFLLKKSKERRQSQFSSQVESLVDEVIQAEYLQFCGPSVNETYKVFLAEFKKRLPEWERQNAQDNSKTGEKIKLKPMGRSNFYKYINRLNPYEVDKARLGVLTARKMHRCSESTKVATRPLSHIEVDAVHFNIALEIKMEDGSIKYERPLVYVAIDVFTRLIVGYEIDYSDGKPGERASAVIALIKQICNPFKKGKHTGIPFPLGGKPDMIISDSGRAFTATTIGLMLDTQGISHHITEKASPWKKPFVERFFGTLKSQCMSKIPGYAGVRKRGVELDKTLEQMAQFNRDEFEEVLERYMLGIYHNNQHRGIGDLTPIEMWESVKDTAAPQILCDFTDLSKYRDFQSTRFICCPKGITVNGVLYNCPELQVLGHKLERQNKRKSDARKVKIFYSEKDIHEITVINPLEDELLCVSTITHGVTQGMSLEQFKATKLGRKSKSNSNNSSTAPKPMSRLQTRQTQDAPSTSPKTDAKDIRQPMSKDAQEEIFSNSIGKHADNHSKKKVTNGRSPNAPFKGKEHENPTPSARR